MRNGGSEGWLLLDASTSTAPQRHRRGNRSLRLRVSVGLEHHKCRSASRLMHRGGLLEAEQAVNSMLKSQVNRHPTSCTLRHQSHTGKHITRRDRSNPAARAATMPAMMAHAKPAAAETRSRATGSTAWKRSTGHRL